VVNKDINSACYSPNVSRMSCIVVMQDAARVTSSVRSTADVSQLVMCVTVKMIVETALMKNIVDTVNVTTFTAISKHVVAAEVPGLLVPWTIRTLDYSYH